MTSLHDATLRRFEDALAETFEANYELTLFVSGASGLSGRAIANAKQLCEHHLKGRYELSVVDLRKDPGAFLSSRVLAAPTLVRSRPLPVRLLVGDLSDTAKVLRALELPPAEGASATSG
jgi:circadian clock protein KaiB